MKIFLFVLVATVFEATGDAVLRLALQQSSLASRIGLFIAGSALLTLYGTCLNLAPVEFATVVGLYLALLFVTFQASNYIFFRTAPTLPVLVGGSFIMAGGMIIALWR